MTISQDFIDFVSEQLEGLPRLRCRRMFGGAAVSADDVQFALLMDNALYFTVDEATRPVYEAMGSRCFSYLRRQVRVEVRRYQEVPADLLEERDRLLPLARESLDIARRQRKPARVAARKTLAKRPATRKAAP